MNSLDTLDVKLHWLINATEIIETYFIRIFGGIGVLFNLYFAYILLHKGLKDKIYGYFWSRAICHFIVSLFAASYMGNCISCPGTSYWLQFYKYYVASIGIRISSLASLISDLFLIFNRYFEITRINNYISRLPKLLNLFLCFSIAIMLEFPVFFMLKITKEPVKGSFALELTEFGSSQFFKLYSIGVFLFETIFPTFLLTVLSSVSVYNFKQMMNTYVNMTTDQTKAKQAQAKFFKMTFILTSICIVSRFLDMAVSIFVRLNLLDSTIFSPSTNVLIVFLKSLTNLNLYAMHALDGIVYLKMESKIWKVFTSSLDPRHVS